jgi:hypothetical protein
MSPPNPELVPIWQEIDKARDERREMERLQSKQDGKLELVNGRIDALDNVMREQRDLLKEHRDESRQGMDGLREEYRTGMERLQGKLEELLQAHQINKGKEVTRREIFWIVATAGSLVVAVWQVVT